MKPISIWFFNRVGRRNIFLALALKLVFTVRIILVTSELRSAAPSLSRHELIVERPHRTLPELSPPSFCSSGHSCCPKVQKTEKAWRQWATPGRTLPPCLTRRHGRKGNFKTAGRHRADLYLQLAANALSGLYPVNTVQRSTGRGLTHFRFRDSSSQGREIDERHTPSSFLSLKLLFLNIFNIQNDIFKSRTYYRLSEERIRIIERTIIKSTINTI